MTLGAISASPSAAARIAWTSSSGPASLSRNPRAPAFECAVDVLVEVERRDDHDRQRVRHVGSGELAGGFDPVEVGHPDVEQTHVRAQLAGQFDGLAPVGRLGDHLDAVLRVEDHPQARCARGPGRRRRARAASRCDSVERDGRLDPPAVRRLRPGVEGAAEEVGPLGHADEPEPRRRTSASSPRRARRRRRPAQITVVGGQQHRDGRDVVARGVAHSSPPPARPGRAPRRPSDRRRRRHRRRAPRPAARRRRGRAARGRRVRAGVAKAGIVQPRREPTMPRISASVRDASCSITASASNAAAASLGADDLSGLGAHRDGRHVVRDRVVQLACEHLAFAGLDLLAVACHAERRGGGSRRRAPPGTGTRATPRSHRRPRSRRWSGWTRARRASRRVRSRRVGPTPIGTARTAGSAGTPSCRTRSADCRTPGRACRSRSRPRTRRRSSPADGSVARAA